jgi:integrase/recombinase XerD
MEEQDINKITFLIQQFRDHLAVEGYSPRVVADYPYNLKFFVRFLEVIDIHGLTDITADMIQQFQIWLYGCKRKDGQPLSLETQRARLLCVKMFFQWQRKRGLILIDPAVDLQMPRIGRRLPKDIPTVKEIRKIMNQPRTETRFGLRDRAILETLYSTGIRNSELCHLTIRDVDLSRQEVRVNNGKGQTDRIVPMGSVAAAYIGQYIEAARPGFVQKHPTDVLFTRGTGKTLTIREIELYVEKYVKRAGINKRITPHTLRHACATHMLKGKASLRHIQEQLGHKTIATTQIYTHVDITDLKKEHQRCHPREQAL